MNDPAAYYGAWLVYLLAGAVYYALFWRITRPRRRQLAAYCLRAWMLSVIATPWFTATTGSALAPALMVVLMDTITISGAAAVRAFIPLFLAMLISQVIAMVVYVVGRKRRDVAPPLNS